MGKAKGILPSNINSIIKDAISDLRDNIENLKKAISDGQKEIIDKIDTDYPTPSSVSTLPEEGTNSISQFTQELYQKPERSLFSSEIPQMVTDVTVTEIPVDPLKVYGINDDNDFALPVGDVPKPDTELTSPKDACDSTHRFSADIYEKNTEIFGKNDTIPTPTEKVKLQFVPGPLISQKEEAEFLPPEGIIQIPTDKLQEPSEEKVVIKNFDVDFCIKDTLDETKKIELQK